MCSLLEISPVSVVNWLYMQGISLLLPGRQTEGRRVQRERGGHCGKRKRRRNQRTGGYKSKVPVQGGPAVVLFYRGGQGAGDYGTGAEKRAAEKLHLQHAFHL